MGLMAFYGPWYGLTTVTLMALLPWSAVVAIASVTGRRTPAAVYLLVPLAGATFAGIGVLTAWTHVEKAFLEPVVLHQHAAASQGLSAVYMFASLMRAALGSYAIAVAGWLALVAMGRDSGQDKRWIRALLPLGAAAIGVAAAPVFHGWIDSPMYWLGALGMGALALPVALLSAIELPQEDEPRARSAHLRLTVVLAGLAGAAWLTAPVLVDVRLAAYEGIRVAMLAGQVPATTMGAEVVARTPTAWLAVITQLGVAAAVLLPLVKPAALDRHARIAASVSALAIAATLVLQAAAGLRGDQFEITDLPPLPEEHRKAP